MFEFDEWAVLIHARANALRSESLRTRNGRMIRKRSSVMLRHDPRTRILSAVPGFLSRMFHLISGMAGRDESVGDNNCLLVREYGRQYFAEEPVSGYMYTIES